MATSDSTNKCAYALWIACGESVCVWYGVPEWLGVLYLFLLPSSSTFLFLWRTPNVQPIVRHQFSDSCVESDSDAGPIQVRGSPLRNEKLGSRLGLLIPRITGSTFWSLYGLQKTKTHTCTMIRLSIEHSGEGLGVMLNNHVSVWRCQISCSFSARESFRE